MNISESLRPSVNRFLLGLLLCATVACNPVKQTQKNMEVGPAQSAARTTISLGKEEAIKLAFDNFKRVFHELHIKSFEPGVWVALPMPSKNKLSCTDKGTYWDILHDGNVGLILHAHVDKASGRVEWQRVSMAFE